MTFSVFISTIKLVISSIFTWIISVSSSLYNNFIFKIILFATIISFIINIIFKFYNKLNNVNENEDEDINIIDSEYWDDEEFEEDDFYD